VYALGKTFQRLRKGGIYGNFVCLENGQEYRIYAVPRLWRLSLWLGKGELVDLTDEDI
jgi:hypothetical protein